MGGNEFIDLYFKINVIEMAKKAYTSYCEFTNFKSLVTGDDLPKWDVLPNNIQAAWKHSISETMVECINDILCSYNINIKNKDDNK